MDEGRMAGGSRRAGAISRTFVRGVFVFRFIFLVSGFTRDLSHEQGAAANR